MHQHGLDRQGKRAEREAQEHEGQAQHRAEDHGEVAGKDSKEVLVGGRLAAQLDLHPGGPGRRPKAVKPSVRPLVVVGGRLLDLEDRVVVAPVERGQLRRHPNGPPDGLPLGGRRHPAVQLHQPLRGVDARRHQQHGQPRREAELALAELRGPHRRVVGWEGLGAQDAGPQVAGGPGKEQRDRQRDPDEDQRTGHHP